MSDAIKAQSDARKKVFFFSSSPPSKLIAVNKKTFAV
jgi:hypothetical protein